MKKYSILLLTLFALLACSQNEVEGGYKNVTVSEIDSLMQKGVSVLDVRTAQEVSQGNIQGSINIDFFADDFEAKINNLDKSKPVLVYCKSGSRSAKASKLLSSNGFNQVFNLVGGYGSWSKVAK